MSTRTPEATARPEGHDYRFVLCERCGSEGRIYSEYRPRWSEPQEIDHGECGECSGTGFAPIVVEPITIEDLSDEQG